MPSKKKAKKGSLSSRWPLVVAILVGILLLTAKYTSPSLSPNSNQDADWKTYTNKLYDFEIQYPSDLTPSVPQSKLYNLRLKRADEDVLFLNVSSADLGSFSGARLKPEKEVVINNIKWTVYPRSTYCDAGMCSDTVITYETINNERLYVFALHKIDAQTFDQILSTFKFVE